MKQHPLKMACFGGVLGAGFTLLEVLATILVFAILTAIAIPALSNWIPSYHLKAAARDLFGGFQMAKSAAIEKGYSCSICFYQPIGPTTYDYVIFLDLDNDLEYDPGEQILVKRQWDTSSFPGISFDKSKGYGKGVTFHKNDEGLPAISFQSSGIPISNTGGLGMGSAYLINKESKVKRIVVSSAGNIRVE